MWGNAFKPKKEETKETTQMLTAEVNGIKISAPTAEALAAMIPQIQGVKPASTLEPDPAAAGPQPVANPQPQPQPQPGQPQVVKWTVEQFQQAMAGGDIHGAIMGIVGQALGIKDFPEHMGQMSRAVEGVYNFSRNNMIGSALVGAGAEPTAANIAKFEQLLGTRPTTEQQPTFENYSKFASHVTAPERQWIAKATVEQPQAQAQQVGADGKPIQPAVGASVIPQPGVVTPGQTPTPTVPGAPVYATNVTGPQAVEQPFPARATPQAPLEGVLMGQQPTGTEDSEAAQTAEGLSLEELEQNLAEASAMPAPA